MKNKKLHPAVETALKKTKQRYIITAVSFVLCAIVFALGFVFKPKTKAVESTKYTEKSAVGDYVTTDIQLTSAMFEQDILDKDNKVTGTKYYVLAVDTESKKFMLGVEKEFYEKNLKHLEKNSVQNVDGTLEILDENEKKEIYGYVAEMPTSLHAQLNNADNEYGKTMISALDMTTVFDMVDEPETVTPFNAFFVAAGFLAIVTLFILMSALSCTMKLKEAKRKYSK
ncbi:MAG: hypothetical protein E7515_06940 [Ruminococcaceae bacterium]|jgi:predicted transposase YbfD/YdcC|nr:hypothetical protein [Oscillospiraceae bacterium]